MEILLITSILFITLMLFLLIPVRVSLKAEKEVSFWYLLSISCLNIFSIAFSPKGRRMKIGFMSFTKHNNNPLLSPFSKGGHRGIFEGGVRRLIDGLKIFKNIKPYFKVEKMKVDGEVGFDNIFLTGLVPLSISILKDFFAENADVNIRPDYFNEGFKGRMEFSGSIRMGFVFLMLGRNILTGGAYV
ncbi:MAG: hypothetical protein AABY58_10755 [Nitrospirota bacterium]